MRFAGASRILRAHAGAIRMGDACRQQLGGVGNCEGLSRAAEVTHRMYGPRCVFRRDEFYGRAIKIYYRRPQRRIRRVLSGQEF